VPCRRWQGLPALVSRPERGLDEPRMNTHGHESGSPASLDQGKARASTIAALSRRPTTFRRQFLLVLQQRLSSFFRPSLGVSAAPHRSASFPFVFIRVHSWFNSQG
jgi:hypothetical protein